MVNYDAVLLFGVVSLMVGSNTGVPIFLDMVDTKQQERKNITPRRRLTTQQRLDTQHLLTTPRPPSATPPRLKSYATNYAAPSYITKAPEYYTTTNAAPAYYTEAPTYFNTTAFEYYT
ncbi:uncharacterized protein LOC124198763 [Daphnia pulex]|uniref:uncharacterized protein LOC124198763 n=1 Tax=Daphnia pulex TaxID=6669 RepID=UPI001EDCE012|nr:uncharacterized protein LOC124198763 [Daphnia pulex]